ncbi:hypothetical protein JB92DRAFT_2870688 [Gautieria morchelliformis]|nr:hypothetical protein JB92DRAFT_2870688 [Gautieria morchelliformis]
MATRFVAVQFKDEYSGDDEKSKQVRDGLFQKHVALYKSRPYVTKVHSMYGGVQPSGQGYHYAVVAKFESEEKAAYYDDVDPEHLEFRTQGRSLVQNIFAWGFPTEN